MHNPLKTMHCFLSKMVSISPVTGADTDFPDMRRIAAWVG